METNFPEASLPSLPTLNCQSIFLRKMAVEYITIELDIKDSNTTVSNTNHQGNETSEVLLRALIIASVPQEYAV